MKSNNKFTTAFPTFPIQDNFGTVQMQYGLNKIELATIIIASQLASHADKYLPETLAEESYKIAEACIEVCEDEFLKAVPQNNLNIIK